MRLLRYLTLVSEEQTDRDVSFLEAQEASELLITIYQALDMAIME